MAVASLWTHGVRRARIDRSLSVDRASRTLFRIHIRKRLYEFRFIEGRIGLHHSVTTCEQCYGCRGAELLSPSYARPIDCHLDRYLARIGAANDSATRRIAPARAPCDCRCRRRARSAIRRTGESQSRQFVSRPQEAWPSISRVPD